MLLLIVKAVGKVSGPLSPPSHRYRELGDTCILNGLCHKRESLSLGNLNLYNGQ